MRFWQLQKPDFDGYRDDYINGNLSYPFHLPPARCETCGKSRWDSRPLPFQLPERFHRRKEIRKGWPIPEADFNRLVADLRQEFRSMGVEPPDLRPGNRFEPGYLDVPSKPRADFLWSEIGSPVVSERVRDLFSTMGVEDIEFRPVTLRKIGKREARLPQTLTSACEPSGMPESVPKPSMTDELGPYYHLIVHGRSGRLPGDEPLWVCPQCGWERSPSLLAVKLVMLESMWKGHEVFFLGSTSFLMVTGRIKVALQNMRATNVVYRSREKEVNVSPLASALREARCCYCGKQPCVGADLGLKRFMCNACNTEYYRYAEEQIHGLPSGLAEADQETRMQAILDATDAHMKRWGSNRAQ